MKSISLNSVRLLNKQEIPFKIHQFSDSIHSANGVAEAVGVSPERVYKTLVALRQSPRAKPLLVMLSANNTLNLKKAARALGEKKLRMASHTEAEKLTGLKVGGISALALLNKGFAVYIDRAAQEQDTILISAGKRGVNLELAVDDLVRVTKAKWIDAA